MLPAEKESPPEVFADLLRERGSAFGLDFPASVVTRLARFLAELDFARRRTNLTGPLKPADLVDHVLESALGGRLISQGGQLVDIGSGAGFPGIPLAIARPDLSVTALEPRRKRAEFLRRVIQTTPVKNASVRQAHASDLEAQIFDAATSRAVGNLAEVIGDADFLKLGGVLLVWTTQPARLAEMLTPFLALERIERVPRSREKVLALYRKVNLLACAGS